MSIAAYKTASLATLLISAGILAAQTIDLPRSKQLMEPVPGHPQRLNSLPVSMAVSTDGRYIVTVNAGFGTFESKYEQSLAVLDTRTGGLVDFPDDRTSARAQQTLYSGLAFSRDGHRLYASMGSITNPLGDGKEATGSGIVVYGFAEGRITPERFIHLPLQQLAQGRKTKLIGEVEGNKGVPFPAAIAVVMMAGAEKLLVADNLSDDVLIVDAASGAIEARFDLAESDAVPSTYPIALAVAKDGARAFVALWNASEIVELNLTGKSVGRKLALLKPSGSMAAGGGSSITSNPPPSSMEATMFLPISWRSPFTVPITTRPAGSAPLEVRCGRISASAAFMARAASSSSGTK